jgi:Holliday junction resolvasome RuvABC endonuclease subunit
MIKDPIKIIGINPGTRYLGISILYDSDLRDWRLRVFLGKWSKEKFEKIKKNIRSLFEKYEPDYVALKKLHPSRRSENLKVLVNWIKTQTMRKGMKISEYSIKDLERFFIKDKKFNKKNLIDQMLKEYPDLHLEYLKKQKSNYTDRIIESSALASRCFYEIDSKRSGR